MQWLNLSYGAWFNRRWQRSGPLVQGPFKAILHEPENTALIINRYIHLNPVRVRALGGHEARSERLREMGELAGGLKYPAFHAAIARFQKRLKIDRELKKVAKTLRIEI